MKVNLYTPGGMFLETYEDVHWKTMSWPHAQRPYLSFRTKDGQKLSTTLPFLIEEDEEYNHC